MNNVLTLIGNPAGTGLGHDAVQLARAALDEAGAATAEPDWLAPELACDIVFDGLAPDEADEAVRQYLRDTAVDIVAQRNHRRAKKLLVADMDSTIIEVECIDELADYIGMRDEVASITERAMRGKLDFNESLRARAAMLEGLKASLLGRAFNDRITYAPGAHKLIRTMRANGARTALVSGGFTYFTDRVYLALGFTTHRANELAIEDGIVTGQLVQPVLIAFGDVIDPVQATDHRDRQVRLIAFAGEGRQINHRDIRLGPGLSGRIKHLPIEPITK